MLAMYWLLLKADETDEWNLEKVSRLHTIPISFVVSYSMKSPSFEVDERDEWNPGRHYSFVILFTPHPQRS